MTSYYDLRDYFKKQGYKVIIAADGETRTHEQQGSEIIAKVPAGGVSVALESIALASNAVYIARGRSEADKKVVDDRGRIAIESHGDKYTLKRLFFSDQELDDYYFGFSNQTLWPLSHAAFEKPVIQKSWYEGYKKVNQKYAEAIREEISGKTFIWIHDYQLALVPLFLGRPKDCVIGFFWHIPWPTWEQYRILPFKKDLLWSLLSCNFVGFHRGYQARNFIDCVRRELEVRIDEETKMIHFDKSTTTVRDLPLGIDTDTIQEAVGFPKQTFIADMIREALGAGPEPKEEKKHDPIEEAFRNYKVILGVDRLDYTKGLPQRLLAIDAFFAKYPQYIKKAIYLGIMAPSRDKIPSYKALRLEVEKLATEINKKYQKDNWVPLHMVYEAFTRDDVITFFQRAGICLVTPLDDGMNLVSKEMVVAAAHAEEPGMLVLSQFAGSAIDLRQALIVNPYDPEEVADAIKRGLEMKKEEKKERMKTMLSRLEDHNIYRWAEDFVRSTLQSAEQ